MRPLNPEKGKHIHKQILNIKLSSYNKIRYEVTVGCVAFVYIDHIRDGQSVLWFVIYFYVGCGHALENRIKKRNVMQCNVM